MSSYTHVLPPDPRRRPAPLGGFPPRQTTLWGVYISIDEITGQEQTGTITVGRELKAAWGAGRNRCEVAQLCGLGRFQDRFEQPQVAAGGPPHLRSHEWRRH